MFARSCCRQLSRSVSKFSNQQIYKNHVFQQISFVHSNSWAAEALIKNGEQLTQVAPEKTIIVTEDLLKNAPEHVLKLADEVLNLTALESMTLTRAMQVLQLTLE